MAILFDEEILKCSCKNPTFREEVIKSYKVINNKSLVQNTSERYLVCNACGKKINVSDYEIKEQ